MKSKQSLITLRVIAALVTLIFAAAATSLAGQTTNIYVDDDNITGTENGSVQNPYNTIQEAIDAASSGDTVAVAGGTYGENILVQDKTVHLFGGYVGGSGGNFSNRDPNANTTHIRGDSTDSVVNLINSGASKVDGFRVTGGTRSSVDSEYYDNGGGFYCSGGSPTISNNLIENNDTYPPVLSGNEASGGGIYASESNLSILSNRIRNNISGRGGGIAIEGGTVTIRDNIIRGNTGKDDHGGGVYIAAPSIEISGNLVLENEVGRDLGYGWGGGIVVYGEGSIATLSRNEITRNYAPLAGSGVFIDDGAEAILDHELIYDNQCPDGAEGGIGVYVDGALEGDPGDPGSKATLIHCTIANNNCNTSLDGNGVFVTRNSHVTVKNCIFWGNGGDDFFTDASCTLTVTYSNSEETISGIGNIFGDPFFANLDNNDYHLQSTTGRWDPMVNGGDGGWVVDTTDSPCIDAGDPASDYSNEPPGSNGGQANMGVYGNTAEASKSIVTSVTDAPSQLPQRFELHQNFPNPFNPETRLGFELPQPGRVILKIFTVLGQEVRTLADEFKPAGSYEVMWNGRDDNGQRQASGVYLYRIEGQEAVLTKKMLLIN